MSRWVNVEGGNCRGGKCHGGNCHRTDMRYGLSDKGTIHVINVLKQSITAGAKIHRYNQRNLQYIYHQNTMFRNDQSQFYGLSKNVQSESSRTRPSIYKDFGLRKLHSTFQTQTTYTRVCECWRSTYTDYKRTHSTHHERQNE